MLDFLLLYISYKKIIQFFYVFVHACNFLSLFPVLFLLHNNPKLTQKYGGGGSVLMSPDFPGSSWLLGYMCRRNRVIVFSSTYGGESTSLHWIISHHCQHTALLWESTCLLLPAQPLPEGFPTSQSWLNSAGHNTKLKDMSVPGKNF